MDYGNDEAEGTVSKMLVISVFCVLAPMTASAQVQPEEARCAALGGMSISSEVIGLPTRGAEIASARHKGKPVEYCEITGTIKPVDPTAPVINFQVNLPYEWNRKGLHYGGAGYNGQIVTGLDRVHFNPDDTPTPLERGYATWGSDSGHQSPTPLHGEFMLNDEALRNFGGDQLKKTYDVAMVAIAAFYGVARPDRVYFQGRSQGGHEGMIVTQRWPEDYDGAIIVHPANSQVGLSLSGNRAGQALYQPDAYLRPSDVELLNKAVLAVCDTLDGALDGLVSNTKGCAAAFDIQTLRCADGRHNRGQCLADAQIDALEVLNSRTETPALQGGARGFSNWPIYLAGDLYGLWGMGSSPKPTVPPSPMENFGLPVLADPLLRYAILRDPSANTLKFTQRGNEARITEVSKLLDAVSDDLTRFASRGGKILLMHGITDFAIPYGNTVEWFERVAARMGMQETRKFMRLWLVPGFGHESGAFHMRWKSLEALENWVENGVAPEKLITTDAAEATAGRSRPMCEYPTFARLKDGAADLESAESYVCVR